MTGSEIGLFFLMAYIVFSEIRNYLERKTLLDRIMSRDFETYYSKELEQKNLVLQNKRIFSQHPDHIEL